MILREARLRLQYTDADELKKSNIPDLVFQTKAEHFLSSLESYLDLENA